MEKGVGMLGKLLNLLNKYGLWNIIKALGVILLLAYVIFFALNPTYLLDRVSEIQSEKHTQAVGRRINADKQIMLLLETALVHTDADRVWLIEFHNGSANLASGLPFLYGSMRLEVVSEGTMPVEEEYTDFSLSRFPLMTKLISDGYHYGSVEDIAKLDNKLYHKLCSNNVHDIAMLCIYNGDTPLGILGMTWCGAGKTLDRDVGMEIRKVGMQIGSVLMQ